MFEILGNVPTWLFPLHLNQKTGLYYVTVPSDLSFKNADLNGNSHSSSSDSMFPHLPRSLSEGHVFPSLKAMAHWSHSLA